MAETWTVPDDVLVSSLKAKYGAKKPTRAMFRQFLVELDRLGWQVVPKEGTKLMKCEGGDYLPATPGGATNECAGRVFEAMLAAAPKVMV